MEKNLEEKWKTRAGSWKSQRKLHANLLFSKNTNFPEPENLPMHFIHIIKKKSRR